MDTDDDGTYLWVTVDEDAKPGRLIVRGELDAASAVELADRIEAARAAGADIALDLADVTFMDSSGLRSLIEVQRRSESEGFEFCVAEASEAVRRVFDLTGTSSLLAP